MDRQLTNEPTASKQPISWGKLWVVSDWLPLIVIYIVFMIGNVLLPSYFWRWNGWIDVAMFLNGVLASEVAIIGVWAAFAADRWTHRLLGSGLLLGLATTCLLIGIQMPPPHRLPLEIALITYAIALAGWLSTWLVLGVWRAWSRWYLHSHSSRTDEIAKTQVSIGYLFAAISSVAVLLAIVRAVTPPSLIWRDSSMLKLLIAAGMFLIYCLLLLVPCIWLAMKKPTPYWLIPLLLLELYFLGWLTMWCVVRYPRLGPFNARETAYFYEFSVGFIASLLLVLGLLRVLGFELRQGADLRNSQPER